VHLYIVGGVPVHLYIFGGVPVHLYIFGGGPVHLLSLAACKCIFYLWRWACVRCQPMLRAIGDVIFVRAVPTDIVSCW